MSVARSGLVQSGNSGTGGKVAVGQHTWEPPMQPGVCPCPQDRCVETAPSVGGPSACLREHSAWHTGGPRKTFSDERMDEEAMTFLPLGSPSSTRSAAWQHQKLRL